MKSDPIVFIPGLLCTEDLFREQILSLQKDTDVLVADTLSDASIEDMAARLVGSAPRRFSLCGLSMGGYVALAVMRQAPESVGRLVLMDTSARPDAADQTRARRELVARADAGEFMEVADELRARILGPTDREDQELRMRILSMAEAVGPKNFARQQEAIIARADSRPSLGQIEVSTLVLVGADDAVTPPELSREMAALIPDARLEIVAGAGHMTSMEQPRSVTGMLRDFLLG